MSFECLNYKPHASGALQGFADFHVQKMGIELYGCGVFMSNGKRWLKLPSREYNDPESGEKKYIQVIRFVNKEHNDAFCKAALHALDQWCAEHAQQQPEPPQDEWVPDEEVPF